mmetsp:Transcript_49065/g.96738  ORF Transcript_49065/g.96738 Transcript_49065/m.96738 type:complete len:161 (+) Transcript_49065:469-951(+)
MQDERRCPVEGCGAQIGGKNSTDHLHAENQRLGQVARVRQQYNEGAHHLPIDRGYIEEDRLTARPDHNTTVRRPNPASFHSLRALVAAALLGRGLLSTDAAYFDSELSKRAARGILKDIAAIRRRHFVGEEEASLSPFALLHCCIESIFSPAPRHLVQIP